MTHSIDNILPNDHTFKERFTSQCYISTHEDNFCFIVLHFWSENNNYLMPLIETRGVQYTVLGLALKKLQPKNIIFSTP